MNKVRNIYRDKVWIDPKVVSTSHKHADNNVEYYCYYESDKSKVNDVYIPEDAVKEFGAVKESYVCFSNLISLIRNSGVKESENKYNRVLYHMKIDKKATAVLTVEKQRRFIELSIKHKMLPAYIDTSTIKTCDESKIVIKTENLSPSHLYMYLCQYRYLREDPGFVDAILHLHDEVGMDFCASFVLASRVTMNYITHHFLTVQRQYGSNKNEVNEVTVPLSTIVSLKRFSRRPKDHDDRSVMGGKDNSRYQASSRIEEICKIKYDLTATELLEPLIVKTFSTMKDVTTKKYLDQYIRLKERIKYREPKSNVAAK